MCLSRAIIARFGPLRPPVFLRLPAFSQGLSGERSGRRKCLGTSRGHSPPPAIRGLASDHSAKMAPSPAATNISTPRPQAVAGKKWGGAPG